jgi:hypothetical protein
MHVCGPTGRVYGIDPIGLGYTYALPGYKKGKLLDLSDLLCR